MANPKCFLDSNILIYTDDKSSTGKQDTAKHLIEIHLRKRSGVISIQVLEEYFSVVTGKLKVDPDVAREKVELSWFDDRFSAIDK